MRRAFQLRSFWCWIGKNTGVCDAFGAAAFSRMGGGWLSETAVLVVVSIATLYVHYMRCLHKSCTPCSFVIASACVCRYWMQGREGGGGVFGAHMPFRMRCAGIWNIEPTLLRSVFGRQLSCSHCRKSGVAVVVSSFAFCLA